MAALTSKLVKHAIARAMVTQTGTRLLPAPQRSARLPQQHLTNNGAHQEHDFFDKAHLRQPSHSGHARPGNWSASRTCLVLLLRNRAVVPSSRIPKVFFSLHACGARTQCTPAPLLTVTAHGSDEACVSPFAVELFACRLSLFELSCNWSSSLCELSCNSPYPVRVVRSSLSCCTLTPALLSPITRRWLRNSNNPCSMSHCPPSGCRWCLHPPVCCSDAAHRSRLSVVATQLKTRCLPRVSTASEHVLETQHEQHVAQLRTSLVSTDIRKNRQTVTWATFSSRVVHHCCATTTLSHGLVPLPIGVGFAVLLAAAPANPS